MDDHPSNKLAPEKRQQLFTIASGEFAQKGFNQASLNRIIAQMGMSKSSFYHYFSNKSDLFRQTMLYATAPVRDIALTIEFSAKSADEIWEEIANTLMKVLPVIQASPLIITAGRMFYRSREDMQGQALTDELLGEVSAWITQLLHLGQTLGAFRKDLPESLLIDLLLSMSMAMDKWILENWDALDDAKRMQFSLTGFDLLKRMLSPVCAASDASS